MIITYQGKENFTIKTKNNAEVSASSSKTVHLGKEFSLGELKILSPGEYESGGVQIEIIDGITEILSEKMTIAWIKKAHVIKDEELEKLNGINVLLIGVGGGEYTETRQAIEVINQIDPSVVIPMYSENLESFLKEEVISSEGIDQFKFTFSDLPTEERKVVVLRPH